MSTIVLLLIALYEMNSWSQPTRSAERPRVLVIWWNIAVELIRFVLQTSIDETQTTALPTQYVITVQFLCFSNATFSLSQAALNRSHLAMRFFSYVPEICFAFVKRRTSSVRALWWAKRATKQSMIEMCFFDKIDNTVYYDCQRFTVA